MNKKVILIITDTQRTGMLGCCRAGDMLYSHPVSHINLAPAIFDVFGIPKANTFEGSSIYRELLTGQPPYNPPAGK